MSIISGFNKVKNYVKTTEGYKLLSRWTSSDTVDVNGKTLTEVVNELGTASKKDVAVSGNASTTQVVMGNDTRLTDSRKASDVSAWAKSSTKPTYTASEVGAYTKTETDIKLNDKANSSHTHGNGDITSLDASKITSGTIDLARLPQGALDRLVKVADDTARFKLTTNDIQLGDTVQTLNNKKMYYVVDESKLSSADGYAAYTADTATSVPWNGITGKPSTYTPSSHTHTKSQITDFPTSMPASDVPAWAKASKKPSYTKSEVGLGNVDNTADANKSVKYATSAGNATKSTGIVDYGSTAKTIQIGYGGDGISGDAIKFIAGYTTGNGSDINAKIKDVSKDALKSWLGLGSLAYSSATIPTIPSSLPANGGNSATVNGHTVNSDVPANAKFTDTDTWRPLGTTADTACAGNDSRLTNARPASDVYAWAKASSKPSYTYSEVGAAAANHSHSGYATTTTTDSLQTQITTINSNIATYYQPFGSSGASLKSGQNLNEFYSGVILGAGMGNAPNDGWWLVVSGGTGGTVTQRAYSLWDGLCYWRYCAAGNWSGWSGTLNCGDITGTGSITISNGNMTSAGVITNALRMPTRAAAQTTAKPNVYFDTAGNLYKSSTTSSKRFKEDVKLVENEDLNPENLYDIDVVQFKYKKSHFTNKEDPRYRKDMIGLIAENVYEHYPMAADYHIGDDGNVVCDGWNEQYLIPAMLKLIQDQHMQLINQEMKIKILEDKVMFM